MTTAAPVTARARSRWRPSPRQLARLAAGLWLFGTGEALVVAARLGNSPWTVFAEGCSLRTPLSIGTATIAISFVVLLLWIPLRQRPGLGTIANAIFVGVAIDATLGLVGERHHDLVRVALLASGIVLIAVGSGLYLGAYLGPGPRDGLMTGLHNRTGLPIAAIRGSLELTVAVGGALLGGRLGVGTIVFALLIGPAVATALRVIRADHASL